jgi:SAM-dependent methyltransferase
MTNVPQDAEQLRAAVRDRYAKTAVQVLGTVPTSESNCCGTTSNCCTPATTVQEPAQTAPASDVSCCANTTLTDKDAISTDLYSQIELGELPAAAALASLGCGNPTALAELHPGEYVLDLGSGGGIDVLLSAKRVGPTGFAYGLDMTDAMLDLAEQNRLVAGTANVKFLKGLIEAIPLPDASVDVIISNCVINLSADKAQVLREAQRVLKPGGRFAVSDIVVQGQLSPALRQSMESWAGCIAGALEEATYGALLSDAGFEDISIEVTRRYSVEDLADSDCCGITPELSPADRAILEGQLVSAFVRANKPLRN